MRFFTSVAIFTSFMIVACGGGGSGKTPDAAVQVDAAIDAPASITGIGQPCVVAMQGADCPAGTDGCLSGGTATMGICTKLCVGPTPPGTFKTDAQAAIPIPPAAGAPAPDPATKNSVCSGAYTGTVGTSACDTFVNVMPAPPLVANTNYTFLAACTVTCGAGNTCPSPLTCNATDMSCNP
jgi:hypothetical protein